MNVSLSPSSLSYTLLLAIAASALSVRCMEPRDLPNQTENECARCHGSEDRAGTKLFQSAPPRDLAGNTDVAYPGVGAHLIHLQSRGGYRALACQECHPVPEMTTSPGHYDDEPPADVHLYGIARRQGHVPEYDFGRRVCSDTYCHGGAETQIWTSPRSSADACGSCHGLPPALPHAQSDECWRCHGEVIDAAGQFLAPDLHVDGIVQTVEPNCSTCHGSAQSSAPPLALDGSTAPTSRSVGAHTAHLDAVSSRSVRCVECHRVPTHINDPGHLDSSPGAEVIFAGVAIRGGHAPQWDPTSATCSDTYCHGGNPTPAWNTPGSVPCGSCHGSPPPSPHPQMDDCSICHGMVADGKDFIGNSALHIDGIVQVSVPQDCHACHGTATTPAPPPDLAGNTNVSAPGVGAHLAHLTPTGRARVLSCNECHLVPDDVLAEGHMDTPLPAEVVFSGVARAFGAAPRYTEGRCADTFCHGGSFVGGQDSGGTLTEPQWTLVDGSQVQCGSCHGLPPPAPHPANADDCTQCHLNVRADGTFIDPDRHVNGHVDF